MDLFALVEKEKEHQYSVHIRLRTTILFLHFSCGYCSSVPMCNSVYGCMLCRSLVAGSLQTGVGLVTS
jgi:hypothetical protein